MLEAKQQRIMSKGVRAEDIKHKNLLTEDQIQCIETEKVYTWIKSGQWKQKDFNKWLKAIRVIE